MLFAQTVNDTSHISQMATLGVDGIATNYPERFIRWRSRAKTGTFQPYHALQS
jgi:hypothetical protein